MKIFIHPIDGAGHINACIGIGQALVKRGHQITMLAGAPYASLVEKAGFRFVLLTDSPKSEEIPQPKPELHQQIKSNNPLKESIETVTGSDMLSNKSPLEKMKIFLNLEENFFDKTYQKCIHYNELIKKEIQIEKPDLWIVDNFLLEPVILKSNIPWILLNSANPLRMYPTNGSLPPFCSGFSINSDKETWKEFKTIIDRFVQMAHQKQNELLRHFGYPEMDQANESFLILSNYMNLYGFPEELDYDDVIPKPENFVRVDAFCRDDPKEYKLPEEFKNRIKPGDKLIYFSLGSMGSFSVPLMQPIINVLAKTPHKYIVSLGPLHAQYQLADNICGEQFLPQTALLPMVDLVITHGGNNTVTETFNFGKPMIVMPLFGDQYDNAQRVQDKGFGYRINPFEFDENVLIESIDKLLFDTELNQRLREISKRIQQSNSKEKACIAIEQMAEKHQTKN